MRVIELTLVGVLVLLCWGQQGQGQLTECVDGITNLINECPELPQLENLREALVSRSIISSDSTFSVTCCEALSQLNSERCFCESDVVDTFAEQTGEEEFLASLLFQASQVSPAGCSIPVFLSLGGEDCSSFGNTIFPDETQEEECTDNLISEAIQASGDLAFLQEGLDLLGLDQQLDSFRSVTVFAPSDQAFEEYAEAQGLTIVDLLVEESLLSSILARHIILNFTGTYDVLESGPVQRTTLDGSLVVIAQSQDGVVTVSGVPTSASNEVCNGVLYTVDRVLDGSEIEEVVTSPEPASTTPPSPSPPMPSPPSPTPSPSPEVVPSPPIVLPSSPPPQVLPPPPVQSPPPPQPSPPPLQTSPPPPVPSLVEGEEPEPSTSTTARQSPDEVTKGVQTELVDPTAPVTPPCEDNLYDIMSSFLPLFSSYLEFVRDNGMQNILQSGSSITLLAPVNTAFVREVNIENWDPFNHLIQTGSFMMGDLIEPANETVLSVNGRVQVITFPNKTTSIGGAEVIQGDVQGCNGYLHVLGDLILDDKLLGLTSPDLLASTSLAAPAPMPEPEPESDASPVPSPSASIRRVPSPSPLAVPSPEPLPSPLVVPSPEPVPSPLPSPEPVPSPSPSPPPSPVPSPIPSPLPSQSPEPSPLPQSSPIPSPTLEPSPVVRPSPVVPSPSPLRISSPTSRLPTLTILPFIDQTRESAEAVPPCTCTENGVSGGIDTGRRGCDEHIPDWPAFCYVINPPACSISKPSNRYPGAQWRNCTVSGSIADIASRSTTERAAIDVASEGLQEFVAVPDPVVEAVQTDSEAGPCKCSENGVSGSVQTGRIGCEAHIPGRDKFCYVVDPPNCQLATASTRFIGAGYRDCRLATDTVVQDPPLTITILPITNEDTGESSWGLFRVQESS